MRLKYLKSLKDIDTILLNQIYKNSLTSIELSEIEMMKNPFSRLFNIWFMNP